MTFETHSRVRGSYRSCLLFVVLVTAGLLGGCATTPVNRDDSGISGAAPGADPMVERARGR